jgi:hypothetical protein
MQSRLGGLGGEVQCPEARRAGGALAVDLRTVEVVALTVVARFGAQVFQTVVGHLVEAAGIEPACPERTGAECRWPGIPVAPCGR